MLIRRHLLAGLAAAPWVRLAHGQPARILTVLHQNDLHSRHDPGAAGVGGSARIAAILAREREAARAEGRVSLTLDAGDQFVGSLYHTHWRGEAERQVMAAIGFDAMTLGNHEFDHGPETLGRFVRALPFPVLAANLDASAEPGLAGHIVPSLLIRRDGLAIGIVGLTLPETPGISAPGPRLAFHPALPALGAEVARLRGAGAATVIGLTHLGLDADRRLVAASRGLDLVVGGHSHTLLANGIAGAAFPCPVVATDSDGRAVPIVQAGANGRFAGRIDLALDAAGRAVAFSGNAIEASGIDPDPQLSALLARLEAPIAELRARVVGEATATMATAGCRSGECALGNAVADAMLDAARRQGAVAAITNAGGLRAPLNAGPVTVGDVIAVLPFGNTLSVLSLSGEELRAVLEHGVSLGPDGAGSGRFPQVAGLAVRFDPRLAPGARIVHLALREADGRERAIDPTGTYRIATNSFLRSGGDGYALLRERARDPYEASLPIDEVLAEAIGRAGRLAPRLDGRLVRAE